MSSYEPPGERGYELEQREHALNIPLYLILSLLTRLVKPVFRQG